LDGGRVGRLDAALTLGGGEEDRLLAEGGELQRPGRAEDADLVALLLGAVAPQPRAQRPGLQLERRADDILSQRRPAEARGVPGHRRDRPEEAVEEVEGVGREADEVRSEEHT